MVSIVTIYSAYDNVGKSTVLANVALLLAAAGHRVGIVDANLQRPSISRLFNLPDLPITCTFNDYLLGMCTSAQAAYDLTSHLPAHTSGRIYLVPASAEPAQLEHVLHQGYHIDLITDGLSTLAAQLDLDLLLIEPPSGLSERTLLAMLTIAIADTLVLVVRPDPRDYQETSVALDVARTLQVPRVLLVVNQISGSLDPQQVRTQLAQTLQCTVGAVIPRVIDASLGMREHLIVRRYPDHEASRELLRLALTLLETPDDEPPANPAAHG